VCNGWNYYSASSSDESMFLASLSASLSREVVSMNAILRSFKNVAALSDPSSANIWRFSSSESF